MKKGLKSLLFSLVLIVSYTLPAQAITVMDFVSTPTSWVGRGESVTVTPADGYTFTPIASMGRLVTIYIENNLGTSSPPNRKYWRAAFAAPVGDVLTPGMFFGATRYPFQDATDPGLSFTGNHRGYNRLSGSFEILESVFFPDGSVDRFAVDFTLFGEMRLTDRIDGKIRYNSTIGLNSQSTIPEPSTFFLVGFGALGLILRRKLT